MSKRRFSQEQIEQLLSNPNISKCSEKSITYSKEFKIMAVKQYIEEGKTSRQIFRDAGFNLNIIQTYTPKNCLKNWRKIYKRKGFNGLNTEARGKGGGRPKLKGLTEKERIKWLEAENAYLKAENDFLAKLRAKRAE